MDFARLLRPMYAGANGAPIECAVASKLVADSDSFRFAFPFPLEKMRFALDSNELLPE
jgi:hypothetical protein